MSTPLDLDAQTLAELEGLRVRLHFPSRHALLSFLASEGLRVTRERLEQAAASDAAPHGVSTRNV